MLSDRCLSVCPVLSVTLVYCGQTVERIKTKLVMQVGLVPGHIVLDADPGAPLPKGHSPQFSVHVFCGQTAAWIKMPLGMAVGLGPGRIVLHDLLSTESPPKSVTDRRTDSSNCSSCFREPRGSQSHSTRHARVYTITIMHTFTKITRQRTSRIWRQ